MKKIFFILFIAVASICRAQTIEITVNPTDTIKRISPYIYGKNNAMPDRDTPLQWRKVKDSGITMYRQNGGNNSSKYNWRKKLTGHPDWYQNVYGTDWDKAAQRLQTQMPDVKGMWGLQLLGWAAKTDTCNFNDWEYNGSQASNWNNRSLAGGGYVVTNANGQETGVVLGDPTKYLEPWPADSVVGILTHWFDSLKLSKEQFQYWNMDNESDIWDGTHDDAMSIDPYATNKKIKAEEYIRRYVEVATRARTIFPEIKFVGPDITTEWQWYNWMDEGSSIPDPANPSGRKYCWTEYFIKRIAEEQQRTGLRLLDVIALHNYSTGGNRTNTLNAYRVYYDTDYVCPYANGVRGVNGYWDNSINKEYIFKRATDWCTQYMGPDHGVTMGITEIGSFYGNDANVIAVSYASMLGTFAENNVEIFTPWDWYTGYWEVVHLFTRYTGSIAVRSTSSENLNVSAYSSINDAKNMLSIVLVNRTDNNRPVNIAPTNVPILNEAVACYQLSNLPATEETFYSRTDNALVSNQIDMIDGVIKMTLPKLSVMVLRVPLKEFSADATLSALTVDAGTLTPSFNPNITDYDVNVVNEVNTITIEAIANDPMARVAGNGNKTLRVGDNSFAITVTAENENTKTYNVTVTRDEKTTGLAFTQNNTLKAWIRDDNLQITGLVAGEALNVYTVTGTLVYHGIAASNEANVLLKIRGVYIVKSGENVVRVIY